MANQDLTRKGKFSEKKTVTASVAKMNFSDLTLTDVHQLIKLPPNALITKSLLKTNAVGVAVATADIGFEGGTGAELHDDVALDAAIGTIVKTTPDLDTGTGKTIIFVPSAEQTQGEWELIIEYIEYRLGTAMLTEIDV